LRSARVGRTPRLAIDGAGCCCGLRPKREAAAIRAAATTGFSERSRPIATLLAYGCSTYSPSGAARSRVSSMRESHRWSSLTSGKPGASTTSASASTGASASHTASSVLPAAYCSSLNGSQTGVAPMISHARVSSSRRARTASSSDVNPQLRSHSPAGPLAAGSPANTVTTVTEVPARAARTIVAPSDSAASSRCGETTTSRPPPNSSLPRPRRVTRGVFHRIARLTGDPRHAPSGPGMLRVLLVDPSSRGGIASYTALIAGALVQAGADPTILGSSALEETTDAAPVIRRLPAARWGKPQQTGLSFYASRAAEWGHSAFEVDRAIRREKPDVVHVQAPINRRFDVHLLRHIVRRQPVVWTAHDVLPFELAPGDRERFAAIYGAVDRVIAHTRPSADEIREIAGVEATVIEHPGPGPLVVVPRAEARERLGLPQEGRILSALGFVRAYKGYDLLADVWERLGPDAPTLLVMGEVIAGEQQPVMDRLVRCEHVDARLSYASEEEIWLAACASDALLLPHIHARDSGVLHLGRAAGVPVIASEAPALAALVRATRTGSVVPRGVDGWAAAMTGELPPPPTPLPSLPSLAAQHIALYQDTLARRAGVKLPSRLRGAWSPAPRSTV
jgi:glycosyltransferase involved in cell wall biosynthesis